MVGELFSHHDLHGFSEQYRENLVKRGIRERYPLQEKVVERLDVLNGRSAIIQAPTASGKTLVAEWCAYRRVMTGKQAWYLVPTRALAMEKFRELEEAFQGTGVEIGLSTGEWKFHDRAILSGDCNIVVSVVEKASRLLFHARLDPNSIGLIVVDEAHLIGDPQRGGELDFLLTWWKALPRNRPQLILLSAVLGNIDELSNWLGIEKFNFNKRMSPLREGTLNLTSGIFRWQERASGSEGTEELFSDFTTFEKFEEADRNLAILLELAKSYGPIIFFVPTRRQAFSLAKKLRFFQDQYGSFFRMGTEENSEYSDGIAVHTAELSAPERIKVEQAFREQKIRLLISTSTLEQGVNLSPNTVVHSPKMLSFDRDFHRQNLSNLSVSRFQNQGGRAGRKAHEIGRSILLAGSDLEEEQLWHAIIDSELESVRSPLLDQSLDTRVCQTLRAFQNLSETEIENIFMQSFAAFQVTDSEWKKKLAKTFVHMRSNQLFMKTNSLNEEVSLTGLGEFIGSWGISFETVTCWNQFLEIQPHPNELEVLFLVQLASEWDDATLPFNKPKSSWYPLFLNLLDECGDSQFIERFVSERGGVSQTYLAKMCQAIQLQLIMNQNDEEQLYSNGVKNRLVRQAIWLLPALTDYFRTLGYVESHTQKLEDLSEKLGKEILAEMNELRALMNQGSSKLFDEENFDQESAVQEARQTEPDDTKDSEIISAAEEERSYSEVSEVDKSDQVRESENNNSELIFLPHRIHWIVWKGRELHLTEMQYRLLAILARTPRSTVPYHQINYMMWPEEPCLDAAIKYHRRGLQKVDDLGKLVQVEHGQGLWLDLEQDLVSLPEEVWQNFKIPDSDPLTSA